MSRYAITQVHVTCVRIGVCTCMCDLSVDPCIGLILNGEVSLSNPPPLFSDFSPACRLLSSHIKGKVCSDFPLVKLVISWHISSSNYILTSPTGLFKRKNKNLWTWTDLGQAHSHAPSHTHTTHKHAHMYTHTTHTLTHKLSRSSQAIFSENAQNLGGL